MANTEPTTLKVAGMTCTNCALGITRKLTKLGLEEVSSNFTSGEVVYKPSQTVSEDTIKAAIQSIGYEVVDADEEHTGLSAVEKRFWFCLVLTVPLFFSMFTPVSWGLHNAWVQLGLCIPVFVVGGWHFAKSAWGSLKSGVANMDVLIIIGSTSAFVYSIIGMVNHLGTHLMHDFLFFETTATIITLVLLGNVLEHRSIAQTTTAIKSLSALQNITTHKVVMINGFETLEDIGAKEIQVGDVLQVNQGDGIPCDGILLTSESLIDESMISGESVPVVHEKDSTLIGGTINAGDVLRIKATAVGAQTVLSGIIKLVKQAQNDKPELQKLSDKISSIFVPVVLGIAVLTLLLAWFVFDIGYQQAMMNAIAVLVISCPCAMGLAIPTAVIAGVGRAAKKGVLIRGGSTLEQLDGIQHIVFDKTGTLTTGKFKIATFTTLPGFEEASVKSALLALESNSSHPIARSIANELKATKAASLKDIEEIKGKGMQGKTADGKVWQVGSKRLLKSPQKGDLFVFYDGKLAASLTLQDDVKPETQLLVSWLKQKGITPIMLSGDRDENCQQVAQAVGIEKVYSEKLPEEKLTLIKQLVQEGKTAMVGDGINDAPALAIADVGISLSDATQVAMQQAQIILVNSHSMSAIQTSILIAKHTMLTVKQNLFWAFFYNTVAIPVAAFGFLNPMVAALTMAFSDVIVIGNSIRLKFKKLR